MRSHSSYHSEPEPEDNNAMVSPEIVRALRAQQAVKDDEADRALLASHIPPGYRLSEAAAHRLAQLSNAINRKQRRALLAIYKRSPLSPEETLVPA